MKKILQLIAVVTLFITGSYAQNIVQGEYFFDADPGVSGAHRFSLTPGADISESLSIPTTGLGPGFHNLFIRVKNEYGIWSQYESRPVYIYDPSTVNQPPAPVKKIVSGEWFVDTDPGIGKATKFALNADTNIVAAIKMQLPTLSVGEHNLFVRVKNEDNVWSQYESQAFSICPAPPAPTAKDTTICAKTPVTLKAKGTGIVNWYTQATGGNYLGSDSLVIDTLTTTTTFYAQDSLCDISATRTALKVNVLANPKVIAVASKTNICIGDTVVLSAIGAKQYAWNVTTTPKGTYKPTETTTLKVIGTDANGCQNTDSVKVVVNTLPDVTAIASKTTICVGDSVQLTSTGTSKVSWDLNVQEGSYVKPTQTTTYQVIGTDVNGCKDTALAVVTVNQLPKVVAKASKEFVCTDDQVTLNGEGAVSYAWDNNVKDNEAFVPTKDYTYTVTGTDANGCTNTAVVGVKIVSLPSIKASVSNDTVCFGEKVKFSVSGAATYTWNNSVTEDEEYAPATTGTFKVTGTDVHGCQNTDSVKVVVNTLPTIVAIASKTTICVGDSIKLSSTGASKVSWNLNVQEGNYVKPTQTTTYKVIGTGSNGCKDSALAVVMVNQLPKVVAKTSKEFVCAGDQVTLNGEGAVSYTWNNNVKDKVAFVPTKDASYTVKGTDINGCSDTASVLVKVNPLNPIVTITTSKMVFCKGDTITFYADGATTFEWGNDGKLLEDNIVLVLHKDTVITVTGTDLGCKSTETFKVVLDATCKNNNTSGVASLSASNFEIYPNPTTGRFTISGAPLGQYSLVNELGATVYSFEVKELVDQTIQIDNLSKGLYFLKGSDASFVKEKIVVID